VRYLRAIWAKPLARAALVFALLVAPWPGLPRLYTGVLAAGLGVVLGTSGPPADLEFGGAPSGSASWDLHVRVTSTVTGQFLETALDARRTGYLPAAVFVALAFVSRLPKKRKAMVVSVGLALLSLLSLLPILSFFSGRLPIIALELSAPARVIVDVLYRSLVAPLGMAYALPALLWGLLSWLLAPSQRGVPERRMSPTSVVAGSAEEVKLAGTRGTAGPKRRKRSKRRS
jgi:hypothetical protein